MAGLLDYDRPDPLTLGLLGFSQAISAPRSRGGGVAAALGAFPAGQMQAAEMRRRMEADELRKQLAQAQIGEYEMKVAEAKRAREMQQQLQDAARRAYTAPSAGSLGGGVAPGSQQGQMLLGQMSGDPEFDSAMLQSTNSALNLVGPQQGISAPTAGGFDQRRFMAEIAQVAPLEAIKMMAEKKADNPFAKIDPKDYTQASVQQFIKTQDFGSLVPVRKREFVNGVAVDAYAAEPGMVARNPDELAQQLIVPDGAGGYKVNQLALDSRKQVAQAGAPNIGPLRFEAKMGDSLSGKVGDIVADSRVKAFGAIKTVETTDQMLAALDKENAFMGPGATAKTTIARLSSTLGVAGKDTQEKLRNTRQLVQGLARIGVAARDQLRGTGSITDSEGAALEKAESGNIDEMTDGEMRDLISVVRKSAALNLDMHRQNLVAMRENPATTPQTRFFEIPGMEDVSARLRTQRPPKQPGAAPAGSTPRPGMVQDGYEFLGGNPADPKSWRQVR